MKDSKAKYQKYKILHLTTGSYVRKSHTAGFYYLSDNPSIFEYKIPYKSMYFRRINKIIKSFVLISWEDFAFNEFEIIEIDD